MGTSAPDFIEEKQLLNDAVLDGLKQDLRRYARAATRTGTASNTRSSTWASRSSTSWTLIQRAETSFRAAPPQ